MDKIIIKGLRIFAFHGVNPEEQEEGQFFVLDIEAQTSLGRASESDDIADTVSYAKMIKCAKRVFAAEKNALIERAAGRVVDALLDEFGALCSVTVRCRKPDAPIKAEFDYVAVEITRART